MHVLQRLVEVAHQGAADAPGGHLADMHAGILQEPAVDADLAELVFDQYQLLAGERLGQQLFDEGRLARAQKTGDNIDLCHSKTFFSRRHSGGTKFFHLYNTPNSQKCKSPLIFAAAGEMLPPADLKNRRARRPCGRRAFVTRPADLRSAGTWTPPAPGRSAGRRRERWRRPFRQRVRSHCARRSCCPRRR